MTTPANLLTSKIIKKLTDAGVFCWRQNNMPVFDPRLNDGYGAYRAHSGLKGVPDILGILRGQFIGIEVKAGKDRLSPEQILFKKRCERNGGIYIVARKVADVDILLQKP